MPDINNTTVGGRTYRRLQLLDRNGAQTRVFLAGTGHRVDPLMCPDCGALVVDPELHNVAHDGPACRVCGCTEENACFPEKGPFAEACHWVEPDLCSNPACVEAAAMAKQAAQAKSAEVVDLVAALRSSVDAAKARREEAGRG